MATTTVPDRLVAARLYGTSEVAAQEIQTAAPGTAAARLTQARIHGMSEWEVKGIVDSGTANVETVPATMAAPVASAPGAGVATVTFEPPSADGGTPVLDYTVTSSVGAVTKTVSASPAAMTGLTAGAQTFTVTARNAVGSSAASPASNSVTVT